MFSSLAYLLDTILDILVNTIEQTSLLNNECLQFFVYAVERVNRLNNLSDLFVAFLHHVNL